MRRAWCLAGVTVVLLSGAGLLRSGEQADPKALIEKALKAHGGADNLAKYPAVLMKGKGKFYGLAEQGLPYQEEWAVQGNKQFKMSLEMTIKDKQRRMILVVNGDKGWLKLEDQEAAEMKKEALDEQKEQMYSGWVVTLVPLKDTGFKLSPAGEVQVDGKAAVGIKVEKQGHRDINLFFDKQSGLLVRSEGVVKDLEAGGKEITQEILYADYKDFEGIKAATRVTLNRNGKRFVEAEYSEVQPRKSLEDSVFARP